MDADESPDVPWLTASAIGQAAYCPYQLYLARGGAVRDAASTAALRRGDTAHRAWNARQRADDRSPALALLRRALFAALVLAVGALTALLVVVLVGR